MLFFLDLDAGGLGSVVYTSNVIPLRQLFVVHVSSRSQKDR
jgi:hypothetical protein